MAIRIIRSENHVLDDGTPTTIAAKAYAWTARISTTQFVFVSTNGAATNDSAPVMEFEDVLIAVAKGEELSLLSSEPNTMAAVAEVDLSA